MYNTYSVICEICGDTFTTSGDQDICPCCAGNSTAKAPSTKVSEKAKKDRAVAKMFGGKALTGSKAQKEWAEKIRAELFAKISAEDAQNLATGGGFLDTARFWIDNRGRKFSYQDVVKTVAIINELNDKTYDTLARTGPVEEKNAARKLIVDTLKAAPVMIRTTFAGFDPY